ncbi:ATP-binding protein [Variovorax sp. J22G73]|uniref:sensor histidine kinase n=1 Tax=unclassified Variovorax TaxID=663243 RepID=UPI0025757827|nr:MULTISPECIES: ATP-binding protein [unclassified Variovorax]MDM0008435.1 ATP-binding protein [Variovorax sp. J22R203]MDM0100942.1 ATP-binding protein [Variovorax sp. J22G73]
MTPLTVATQAIARRAKGWLQPSLLRRLLLAQIGVVALLWGATVALFLYDSNKLTELVRYDKVFACVIEAAQHLAHDPARQQATLKAFDLALLETSGDFNSETDKAPVMQVWQRGRLIYNSTEAMPAMQTSAPGRIENIRIGHRLWRARTMSSPLLDTRVLLAEPDFLRLNFTIETRSYYLLPLGISLPILVFPAWLSVLLALRPWRQVTQETAARGPADLSPLSFEPPHKELQPLVRGINGLLRSLRERNARERGLIADAANELRTPLDAMRVNVEALKAQTADRGQRELMANLLRSNDRASRLVGQLQQLMRSDEMPQDATPVVLAFDVLVRERIALIDSLAHARGIAIDFVHPGGEADVPVFGERESLISMVSNVVENAVKYSPDGGRVTVHVFREAGQAVLRVTDQGPGIPPALRERVFDRFFRNPDQTQSGSGLGLAIVRAVLREHGGEVVLEDGEGNGEGRGLCVTVRLPLSVG